MGSAAEPIGSLGTTRSLLASEGKGFETRTTWQSQYPKNRRESTDPDHPTIYRGGEVAEAEPAVPGWTMAVDDLFV